MKKVFKIIVFLTTIHTMFNKNLTNKERHYSRKI